MIYRILWTLGIIISIGAQSLNAQYFGRNKPRYQTFDFKVLETPHFDLHYYMKNREVLNNFAQQSEEWYDYHRQVIGDSVNFRNPMIIYNNHAEFQQTNTISGSIGVGTGGVTEAFKNRVIMPLTFSNQATRHVLGHEMVHAFQFYGILNGDSTSLQSLSNLPLWMVEGLAEYMSLGRVDPFTSMWMRDALINEGLPTIEKMQNPKYFPYRYGQAFWSSLTATYGDHIIAPLFKATAIFGLKSASQLIFNMPLDSLSTIWTDRMIAHYDPYLKDKKDVPQGKKLFSKENSGSLNVSPSLSPNGRYVVFLSEKDIFTTELFLADVRSGEVVRKVTSTVKDGDIDHLNYLESSGTWSPNGKDYAYIVFKNGRNAIVIRDTEKGKTTQTIFLDKVAAMTNPAWSPDGSYIIFTGSHEGQVDLYKYTLRSKRVEQLTNDIYSEIMVNFNDDGSKITFSYDKRSMTEGRTNGQIPYDIAIMDIATKEIQILDVFHGAENLNPSFDHEGNIYFVSERDGFRNLYRYITSTGEVFQMTDLITGISGISRYSPMITVSTKQDKVLYTYFNNTEYSIYSATIPQMLNKAVDPKAVDFTAGTITLPANRSNYVDIVNKNLRNSDDYPLMDPSNFKVEKYQPKFKLDYIGGGTGIGVGNNTFGTATGLQGGIDFLFSDMLGNNQLFGQAVLNGEIFDAGGQFSYLNRKNKLALGVGLSHIPLRTGYQTFFADQIQIGDNVVDVLNNQINLIRVFDEGLSAFAHFPFSTTVRLEGGVRGSFRSFRYDQYNDYYQTDGFNYYYLGQERERIPVPDTININQYYSLVKGFGASVNVALVGDNSFFGLTSPLAGYRYRFGVDKYVGTDDYWSVTADYRHYFWKKPFSLALRFTGNARFENRVNSVFPYYVGQQGFVRGYGSIFSYDVINDLGLDFSQVLGSKIAVTGAELRMPFTGPKQLALIGSNFLFTDLVLFADAGIAFNDFDHISNGYRAEVYVRDENGNIATDQFGNPQTTITTIKPVFARSVGIALRANLFGYVVVEPYLARQLQENGRFTFGLNLTPGW